MVCRRIATMGNENDRSTRFSRRGFVRIAGASAGVGLLGGTAAADDYDDHTAQTIRLRAQVPGWLGEFPLSVTGRRNPTLQLTVGEKYEVIWTNTDGVQHDFVVLDADGNPFGFTRTSSSQTPGATRTSTFVAESGMAGYQCSFHPETMTGDVETSE